MDWFFLALLAPALWSIVNIIDDNLIRGVYRNPAFGTIISGLLGLMPLAIIPFVDVIIPDPTIVFFAVLSGFLIVCSYCFYFKSLLSETPSSVAALWALTPALVPFFAFFLLGEVLTLYQYLGFAIILSASLGISAIDIKRFRFSSALYFMIAASILAALASILFKHVYSATDFWSGFVFVSMGMGLAGFFFIVISSEGRKFFSQAYEMRKWFSFFVLCEILNIAAVFVSNLAISKGPVSLVKVVEGIHPIYLLVFALVLHPFFPKYFRDAKSSRKLNKLLLMLVMVAGLYLINQ